MTDVRRCLGCSATYPADGYACPECGSHAADVEEATAQDSAAEDTAPAAPKPRRQRRKA